MSTKDIRFILPLYPLFCIYLAIFINSKKHKFFTKKIKINILIISIIISLLSSNDGLIRSYISFYKDKYKWPHSDIIREIEEKNPNLISTLAVLPDTRNLNTSTLKRSGKARRTCSRQASS